MTFEHFAINVANARELAAWYVHHLGLKIVRQRADAPYTHFLADETGRVILEVYSNPAAYVPDYASQHPLVFHIAFISKNTTEDRARLEAAGAVFVYEDRPDERSSLIMMRDPWGIVLQFCQRAEPL